MSSLRKHVSVSFVCRKSEFDFKWENLSLVDDLVTWNRYFEFYAYVLVYSEICGIFYLSGLSFRCMRYFVSSFGAKAYDFVVFSIPLLFLGGVSVWRIHFSVRWPSGQHPSRWSPWCNSLLRLRSAGNLARDQVRTCRRFDGGPGNVGSDSWCATGRMQLNSGVLHVEIQRDTVEATFLRRGTEQLSGATSSSGCFFWVVVSFPLSYFCVLPERWIY